MSDARLERRLAAVLAADVAGYSRLMGDDEEGTLRTLAAYRSETIDPTIAAHKGRIVKTTGDGVLVEFTSVIDAVSCAIEIQQAMTERNEHVPRARRVDLRIGINIGDVIVQDGDIFGDGVNVAARLEGIAEPGGIWVSGVVRDQIGNRLNVSFIDLGERQLKNITQSVRIFRIEPAALPAGSTTLSQRPDSRLSERPSIAVLPFNNMSGAPEQDYFGDGMAEDIITALSHIKWFFVVARNSSFTYKGRAVDIKQIGRELGVRYVMEGSIRRAASKVRITAQLIDAETGHHIWADRWDGSDEDVFDLQDRITQRVVAAIEPSIQTREIERNRTKPTDSLEAYDLYLRALPEFYAYSEDGYRAAEKLLRRAVTLDPSYSDGWAALADCLGRLHVGGWAHDAVHSKAAIEEAVASAVRTGADNASALAISAWANAIVLDNPRQAATLAQRAIELHPNSAYIRSQCGWAYVFLGEQDKAIVQFETAYRFNPVDPRSYTVFSGLAAAHFFEGRYEEAVHWASRARSQNPSYPIALRFLAASIAHMGRHDEAADVVKNLLEVQPNATLARATRSSFAKPEMMQIYVDGLKKAGLPE
jgi:adenylate cyclase